MRLEASAYAHCAVLQGDVLARKQDEWYVVRLELYCLQRLWKVCRRKPQAVPPRVEPLLKLPVRLSELDKLLVAALPHLHCADALG